ncbi:SDR family NAD(P)-dependent oxidoreductase [Kytococcus sedentarius]|uniref:SDR family NAD(P)-dependent oxidoreductase n=1 Tax=Kytococcus sedentarius TaxID=1276 RepID=UPI0035BC6072
MAERAQDRPTALVVGATRGIGAEIARGFARAGHDLVLTGRDAKALAEVAEDCRAEGAWVTCHPLDVTDTEAVQQVLETAWSEAGRLEVAVVSAGVIEAERPLWEVPLEELWEVMTVNVRGPLAVAHALVPRMIKAGGGRIVHLNSGSGTKNAPVYPAYHASKSALARITGSVAMAAGEHGVHAFDLAPGVVRTDMTASMPMHDQRTDWTEPQDVVELALALASGELDAFSGRMVRAGADTPESLRAAAAGLGETDRTLGLLSYGPDDPVA